MLCLKYLNCKQISQYLILCYLHIVIEKALLLELRTLRVNQQYETHKI